MKSKQKSSGAAATSNNSKVRKKGDAIIEQIMQNFQKAALTGSGGNELAHSHRLDAPNRRKRSSRRQPLRQSRSPEFETSYERALYQKLQ